MNKSNRGLLTGYLVMVALIILTGAISISAAKQPTGSIFTGFDVTQP